MSLKLLRLFRECPPGRRAEFFAALAPKKRLSLQKTIDDLRDRQKLSYYKPYPKQSEFHESGAKFRRRLFMAGNQTGKTLAGGTEIAMHLTGLYPPDWKGKRFDKAVKFWVGSNTTTATRDNPQRILIGPALREEEWGTGAIPKKCLKGFARAKYPPGALDGVSVQHVSGKMSSVGFKSYDQGRERWQGETLDGVWFDEEPPEDIYTEGLTRTNATQGIIILTFTPLLGMSNVVRDFLAQEGTYCHVTRASLKDALHYTDEQRKEIAAQYKDYEREARVDGIPQLGSGAVFQYPEETISCEPFQPPSYWPQLGAVDFGWDHPFAAVRIAWDRDNDVVYVIQTYRDRQSTPLIHCAALKEWGEGLPFAWPHDGLQHDKGSGVPLAKQYRDQGLKMLPERATFPDGTFGFEAGVSEMSLRFQSGRLKVFNYLTDWFEEFRFYHRKDGLVVKEQDDLMCLHGATLVITDQGKKRIDALVGTSGKVLTIGGRWAEYNNCRKTRQDAEILEIVFSDGTIIHSTPDHKFLTVDGWKEAASLEGETCKLSSVGQMSKSSTARSTRGSEDIFGDPENFSTGRFGRFIMAPFRRAITFITSTATGRTTGSKISPLSMAGSTFPGTKKDISAAQTPLSRRRPNGEKPQRGLRSIKLWVARTLTSCIRSASSLASGAARRLMQSLAAVIGFAPTSASLAGVGPLGSMLLGDCVWFVGLRSGLQNLVRPKPVRRSAAVKSAARSAVVCRKVREAGRADTYCMEVPGHEAFAVESGVIVHNCATRYAIMMLRHAKVPTEPKRGTRQAKADGEYRPHTW